MSTIEKLIIIHLVYGNSIYDTFFSVLQLIIHLSGVCVCVCVRASVIIIKI